MKIRTLGALLLLAAAGTSPLFALRPGENALELNKINWLRGGISLAPEPDSAAASPRIVVFVLTRGTTAPETFAMLRNLSSRHPGLRTAVITPDPAADAEALLRRINPGSVAFGLDSERAITPQYMAGSLFYPTAFLIASDGRIIWRGEAVDLPEALQSYFAGKLDLKLQTRLSPLLEELQTLIRDSNDIKMRRLTDEILELDPANPAALRIRIFTLENTGRQTDAWQLLTREISRSPQVPRLYFTALDLATRYPVLRPELPAVLKQFASKVTAFDSRNLMAWSLLNALPGDGTALTAAAELCRGLSDAGLSAPETASLHATRALLAYRLGRPDQALAEQQQAIRLLGNRSGTELAAFREREAFYRTVLELRDRGL